MDEQHLPLPIPQPYNQFAKTVSRSKPTGIGRQNNVVGIEKTRSKSFSQAWRGNQGFFLVCVYECLVLFAKQTTNIEIHQHALWINFSWCIIRVLVAAAPRRVFPMPKTTNVVACHHSNIFGGFKLLLKTCSWIDIRYGFMYKQHRANVCFWTRRHPLDTGFNMPFSAQPTLNSRRLSRRHVSDVAESILIHNTIPKHLPIAICDRDGATTINKVHTKWTPMPPQTIILRCFARLAIRCERQHRGGGEVCWLVNIDWSPHQHLWNISGF